MGHPLPGWRRRNDRTPSGVRDLGVSRRDPGSGRRFQAVKFVCLVYGEEHLMATVPDAECMANGVALQSKGHYVAAEALRPVRDAVTVRVRNGAMSIIDG